MQVSSGKIFDRLDLKIIRLMVQHGFIRWSDAPFKLKSGVDSHIYVFGREDLTDHPDLEWLIGKKIARVIKAASLPQDKQPCLIGIPTAGTALAQAAAMASQVKRILVARKPICHRIMREVMKQHGVHRGWVNGRPEPDRHTYWIVDNVITDGKSKIEAEEKLISDGYPSKSPTLIFIDRGQGGIQKLEQAGFQRITVVYHLLDLVHAFGELDLWSEERVRKAEEEIKPASLFE